MTSSAVEGVWRREAPHVLAALLRRHGDFAACEDAVQDALVAASQQWPTDGLPDRPRGWLVTVAGRRLIDHERRESARRHREERAALDPLTGSLAGGPVESPDPLAAPRLDDTLHLLVLCAHPALRPASQVALTLRAVAGLTTAQIAAAFLVPEPTMAQRISRAKATIVRAGTQMPEPVPHDLVARVQAVRHVLYLTFNEGYTASSGPALVDVDLANEAIRLTEALHRSLPTDTETTGLLALMLLTHARTPARIDGQGDLVPLVDQDRARWDRALIDRGARLVEAALPVGPVGPFQLQAAIAAVHAEAISADETDWPQIVELYRMLERIAASPVVVLNHAVAIGMADGPSAGLAALQPLLDDPAQLRNHRVHSVNAHLLESSGDVAAAVAAFRRAASLTSSIPEQRYLNARATSLTGQA